MGIFGKLFSPYKALERRVEEIHALEEPLRTKSDAVLLEESRALRDAVLGVPLEEREVKLTELLPRAFALVRETARRTLGQRHFDVQLMGGVVLHEGKIAEMRTGEGKTLSATLPVYLNALRGEGVHVVTVNEYLAKRDAVWMGQVYHALGMSVACLVHEGAMLYDPTWKIDQRAEGMIDAERDSTGSFLVQTNYLRPIPRREAYLADITYGTNHEFGFDYLRDNLAHRREGQVQRGHPYAVIDEVDSILIDEARTPLIISAPDRESSNFYKTFARVVTRLDRETDYLVDEKHRSVDITDEGINKVEKMVGIQNLYSPDNLRLTHYLQESLRAKELYLKDRDYVNKAGEIIIVDQFTGRLMLGRRYSGGLHQAIEAKEGVAIKEESRTYAQISIQNYFRLYKKLGGMTGTAETSAEEFDKVYKLPVVTIPTHQPMIRLDLQDLVYKNKDAKYDAIVKDIKERHEKGQPILIGTVSIEKNEELSRRLFKAGLSHEVLNAKNNEREGSIIAQAGKYGAITVATNMAGRGVDIILGGNPPSPNEAQKVKDAGGLHVVGTERHDSRRIDNQLRGRGGRQGDPGSSQFFLSVEDDLMRIFGGDRIKGLMETLKVPDDMPIQAGMLNRVIAQAQSKVEGMNFDARKHLLEYDDVLNKQRLAIYKKRQQILEEQKVLPINNQRPTNSDGEIESETPKPQTLDLVPLSPSALAMVLSMLDMMWMNHLENMEELADGVRLRAYGQHDPLVEYRREGYLMYQEMLKQFDVWLSENAERLSSTNKESSSSNNESKTNERISVAPFGNSKKDSTFVDGAKVGRNDPCPCGSGKKYKKCHGQNG